MWCERCLYNNDDDHGNEQKTKVQSKKIYEASIQHFINSAKFLVIKRCTKDLSYLLKSVCNIRVLYIAYQ